jgi:hypothetical protein
MEIKFETEEKVVCAVCGQALEVEDMTPRYTYRNRLYIAHGAPHGLRCDPVRREDGRCIVGPGRAQVVFEDGEECIVIRRALRLARDATP